MINNIFNSFCIIFKSYTVETNLKIPDDLHRTKKYLVFIPSREVVAVFLALIDLNILFDFFRVHMVVHDVHQKGVVLTILFDGLHVPFYSIAL